MSASTEVFLDTRGPAVIADAVTQVDPPEIWIVGFEGDEEIAYSNLVFRDAMGVEHSVGYTRLGVGVIRYEIPTGSLATGPGMLTGHMADDVGNASFVQVPVSINRESVFDATLSIERAFSTSGTIDHAFEASLTMEIS